MPELHRAIQALETEPLNAFIYNRASRDPKRRGRSTSDQSAENHAVCEDQGWIVAGEFTDDDRSASRHARRTRDEFEAMAERIRAGECDVLVTWESSRANRTMDGYVRLRKLIEETGVLWHYGGHTYDMTNRRDRRDSAQDALQAEDEAEAIRERILRTTRRNAQRGGPHGRIPYGYTREYDPRTGELIAQIPDPREAPVAQEIFARLAAAETGYAIAQDLTERQIYRRSGEPWDGDSVLRLARSSETYIGRRVHQGKTVGDAAWDGIIEPEIFHAVKRLLVVPGRRTNRDTAVRHLLSGIAVCGAKGCGSPLYILKNRGYLTYTCHSGVHVACAEHRLDAYVEEAVVQWLASPASREAFRSVDSSEKVSQALAEIDRLQAELGDAQRLVAMRKLSVASLAAVEAGLLPEIERFRRVAQAAQIPEVVRDLVGAVDADVRWNALTIKPKRAALRAIVEVRLHTGRRGVRRIEPGRVGLRFLGDPEDG